MSTEQQQPGVTTPPATQTVGTAAVPAHPSPAAQSPSIEEGGDWRTNFNTRLNPTDGKPSDDAAAVSGSASLPCKRIHCMEDMARFKASKSYSVIVEFLTDLCKSVRGKPRPEKDVAPPVPPVIAPLLQMFVVMRQWVEQIPLQDMKAQRFGNKAFRDFCAKLVAEVHSMVDTLLPPCSSAAASASGPRVGEQSADAQQKRRQVYSHEMSVYLTDSFGNATRMDFGTGHELHFFIVLMLWCDYLVECGALRGLATRADPALLEPLVWHVVWEYVQFMRLLQSHYKLEPAGSHGVWGLDDYHHIPFIIGASQLIGKEHALQPKTITDPNIVARNKEHYFYYDMVHWIFENKKGPFFEHSSVLYNVSGLDSWERIMTGMLKMFQGEVLNKHTIVQHLLFGELFPW